MKAAETGKRPARLLGGICVVAVVLVAAGWSVNRVRESFRMAEVVPGQVYRSSQPGTRDLAELVSRIGLRQVLNLRGYWEGEPWHVAEVEACRDLGIAHTDVRVLIPDWVAQHEARRFVALLEESEKPLLIHCKNGSDRAGWGAAVASLLAGASLDSGLRELSPWHGHFCRRSECYLHGFFDLYIRHLRERGLGHDAGVFRQWITEEYVPDPYAAALVLVDGEGARLVETGETLEYEVRVTNTSRMPWLMKPGPKGVRLGARVLGPFEILPEHPINIFRTPNNPARDVARDGMVEGVMEPGETREFRLRFAAPATPGEYILHIDMVNELVHWFSDLGGPGLLFNLVVAAPSADAAQLPPRP